MGPQEDASARPSEASTQPIVPLPSGPSYRVSNSSKQSTHASSATTKPRGFLRLMPSLRGYPSRRQLPVSKPRAPHRQQQQQQQLLRQTGTILSSIGNRGRRASEKMTSQRARVIQMSMAPAILPRGPAPLLQAQGCSAALYSPTPPLSTPPLTALRPSSLHDWPARGGVKEVVAKRACFLAARWLEYCLMHMRPSQPSIGPTGRLL